MKENGGRLLDKRLNSFIYTKGKFDRGYGRPVDTDTEYLYSKGRYKTKIKKEDLPDDYIEFRSGTIRYMTGYLKTSGVVDIDYTYFLENHIFKDDYLYISYKEKLKKEKASYGREYFVNYDVCICGNDIIPILLAIEKNSNINIDKVKEKIYYKVSWYKENCKDEYTREFGNRDIDIFEEYK